MKKPQASVTSEPRTSRRSRTENQGTPEKRIKVFISYSKKDYDKVNRIVGVLREIGLDVWTDFSKLRPGDDINDVTFNAIDDADIVLIVISENSLRSQWVQAETSAAVVSKQISGKSKHVIPIRLDEAAVPSLIGQFYYIDFSQDFKAGLSRLALSLQDISKNQQAESERRDKQQTRDLHEQQLHDALRRGRLTLVCGAGVSIAAGVPSWHNLLARLLTKMLKNVSSKHSISLDADTSAVIQSELGKSSSLILGKYLKNNLRDEFEKEIRTSLYASASNKSDLIESIANLARPQREGRPLESIITFNFDDMIEKELDSLLISNKPIFSESINHEPNQIPIYHVHGFLPRNGEIPKADLVFSEDAYHNQFIDPFSWSNLIQLNKLSQSVCLFVGISLTDPNMRRLLDVAWRKNPGKTRTHYIIKKSSGLREGKATNKISNILEEQDANLLGLNVIWVDEFDEIPSLINRISIHK